MFPIETAPQGLKILLRFERLPDAFSHDEPLWIEGWWFTTGLSNQRDDDGWETPLGFIGEPTHWAHLPKGDVE